MGLSVRFHPLARGRRAQLEHRTQSRRRRPKLPLLCSFGISVKMLCYAQTFEKVNRVDGLVGFLRRWDQKDELKFKELRFAVADGGNINLRGTSECSESFLLTRWHPSFIASVEAGVRELVICLVTSWDCVTYSSCEGHRSGAHVSARARHVRMISRSKAEHLRLQVMLNRLVNMTNSNMEETSVLLVWKNSVILADNDLEAPGLDLIFEPQLGNEDLYWKILESCYKRCLHHLSTLTGEMCDETTILNSGLAVR